MVNDKYLLAKEFLFLSSDDININKFMKLPNDNMTYETTRSAFIIPISGKSEICFSNQKFIATPGKIIHGCPHKKVSFNVIGDEPFHHINIYYSGHLTKCNYSNSTFDFIVDNFTHLTKLLEEFYLICNTTNVKKQLKKEFVFQSILSMMFSTPKSINSQKKLIENSVEYIKENYCCPITLKDLANKYNKSPQQFSYLFYKYMRIRPIDYIIQYRLKKSLEMLEEGYKVREVASYIGYNDPYYFSRLFKKHFGLPPSEIVKSKLISENKSLIFMNKDKIKIKKDYSH